MKYFLQKEENALKMIYFIPTCFTFTCETTKIPNLEDNSKRKQMAKSKAENTSNE